MIGEEKEVPPAPGQSTGGWEQEVPPGPLKQNG